MDDLYIFWFIGLFFGLVIFVHSVKQTAKVVMRLGNIQQVGKRHRQDGKAICPAIVDERRLQTSNCRTHRFFIATLLNTLSSSPRDIMIVWNQ